MRKKAEQRPALYFGLSIFPTPTNPRFCRFWPTDLVAARISNLSSICMMCWWWWVLALALGIGSRSRSPPCPWRLALTPARLASLPGQRATGSRGCKQPAAHIGRDQSSWSVECVARSHQDTADARGGSCAHKAAATALCSRDYSRHVFRQQ